MYEDSLTMPPSIYSLDPGEKAYFQSNRHTLNRGETIILEGYGYSSAYRGEGYLYGAEGYVIDVNRNVVADYLYNDGIYDIVNSYHYNGNVDFNKANILRVTSIDSFNSLQNLSGEIFFTNVGDMPISCFGYNIGAFTEEGLYIHDTPNQWDVWFADIPLAPGETVSNTFEEEGYNYSDWRDVFGINVQNYGMYRYEYILEEPDEDGNQFFVVDLKNHIAYGYLPSED